MTSTRVDWTTSSLGERIEHICSLRGWTLNKLGEESGIASGPISRLSRRKETTAASPDTLIRIADAANVNAIWLIAGRGPVERERRGTLRAHPEWSVALAEAKKRQRGIPEAFWEIVAEYPAPRRIDWQLLVGFVRELYSAHQRFEEDEPEQSPDEQERQPERRSSRRPGSGKQ
jgi:transcriptional regulator with XRE-family HTH domain